MESQTGASATTGSSYNGCTLYGKLNIKKHKKGLLSMQNSAQTEPDQVNVDWQQIEKIIKTYKGSREALLMIMQDISDIYNYVPVEVIPLLVEKLGVKESLIYSVATFYKTISLEPRGKFIVNVCTGTACHVRGADKIMEALENKLDIYEGQTTGDSLFTLEAVRCIGCCASGPVITVNQDTHGGLDRSKVTKIIDEYSQRAS
ncbi:MAG: NAD(P)H-dependent oxidoreductase subunit E [Desulfobacterales bacterium]|jgi:NADH:ubiquinone oxidoreductase subunit E